MLSFQLLGPVEVRLDGQLVTLGGPKQRALLALLVLSANEVVSRQRLIAGLWGDKPPRGVEHALDAQVSTLRQTLALPGCPAVERLSPGYRFAVDPDTVDVTRFDRLVATGRRLMAAGDAAAAASTLREALELWRGPALADVQRAPFAAEAAGELDRRHVDALEERVDADLACGHGAELVPELEGLVHEHPFRERLLVGLALALYRGGQQARALEVIAAARREFATELGLQPGAAVLELEARILRQDPGLQVTRPTASTPVPPAAARPADRGRRRMRWLAAAMVAALVIGGASAVGASKGRAPDPSLPSDRPALASIDIASGRAGDQVALPAIPSAVVAGLAGVWVSGASNNEVSLVDPATNAIAVRLPIPGSPGAMAAGDGAVWVAGTVGGAVVRVDEQSKQVTQTVAVGGVPSALAFAAHRLWVADQNGRRLLGINPDTGRVQSSLALVDRPTALIADSSGLWVASHDANTVTLVDPASVSTIAYVHVGGGPTAIAGGGGSIWVANNDDATVSRLDPRTAQVQATLPVNSGPVALTFAAGVLWVAGDHANTLGRVDPSRNAMTQQIPIQGSPVGLATFGDRLWLGTRPTSDLRGGTLTMLAPRAPSTVDPGFQFEFLPPQLLGLTQDSLLTFNHASGPRGLELVPDLAVAVPSPAASATIFTFRLRPGIRYSTGEPVRAGDFRRAMERLFRGSSPGTTYFAGLVGASRCRAQPQSCTLAHGVVTNDTAQTVSFRLSSPDPDFLFRLALIYAAPVPPGTPTGDTGLTPVPGTGPYRIADADTHRIRLERNPLFREWSYAAQPAGNPDELVWRFGLDRAAQVSAVRRGDADWMFQGIPADRWTEIRNHEVAQLHVNDMPETDFLLLRTRVPPFNDIRARRAFNLAIDRRVVVTAYGGPDQAAPTCQVIPPGETARVTFCPYTRDDGPDGGWSAPDLRRAERLVTDSGTRGMTVKVLGISDSSYPPAEVAQVAARTLTQLGYRVQLRMMTQAAFDRLPISEQTAFDVSPFAWYADFPSPSTFFQTIFACDTPLIQGRISCDQTLDRQIQSALRKEVTSLGSQDTTWAAVDRRATSQALTVPLVNPRAVELTSSRLQGYEYNPQWGFLPAQASLR